MRIKDLTDIQPIAHYLYRIGAEARSLRTAVVKQVHGAYWTDIAVIRFSKDGTIEAPEKYAPTPAEAEAIKAACIGIDWPEMVKIGKGQALPPALIGVNPEKIFTFKNLKNETIMLRHRIDDVKNDEPKQMVKKYIPWTLWSDGEWRCAEPEGKLPLFGLENVKDNSTAFLHEGEKAARFVQNLINPATEAEKKALASHPWGDELGNAVHLGWIGGALSPGRTNWQILKQAGIKTIWLIADNDAPGKEAISKISKLLSDLPDILVMAVLFTDQFPACFDLADEFPDDMFKMNTGKISFVGPTFRALGQVATWATNKEVIPNPAGKGKDLTVVRLRREFARQWLWVRENNVYACKMRPNCQYDAAIFNKVIRPFSDVSNTAELLDRETSQVDILTYQPAKIPERILMIEGDKRAFNVFTPTTVRGIKGDVGPWLKFLDYLFPIETERKEVMRWCATLISRPEVRMKYGILLASKAQGVGKNTLGEHILAKLVGYQNVSMPNEKEIVESEFNSWLANKRLVFVGEIYEGQSWKAYNKLKSYVTDANARVNEKHARRYDTAIFAHFFLCSNSEIALKIEESDRRWLYPTLNNVPWLKEQWVEFYSWIEGGGLSIIMHWAENFGDYVEPSARAPTSVRKEELIHASKSEGVQLFEAWLDGFDEEKDEVSFVQDQLMTWLKKECPKMFEQWPDIARIAGQRKWGYTKNEHRIRFGGQPLCSLLSPRSFRIYKNMQEDGKENSDILYYIKSIHKRPVEPGKEPMYGEDGHLESIEVPDREAERK